MCKGRTKRGRITKKAMDWMTGHEDVIEEYFYKEHVKVSGREEVFLELGKERKLLQGILFLNGAIELQFEPFVADEIMDISEVNTRILGFVKRESLPACHLTSLDTLNITKDIPATTIRKMLILLDFEQIKE